MKKLFLYVILFAGIFALCYILANEYFQVKMQEKNQNRQELAEKSITLETDTGKGRYVAGIKEGRVVVYDAASGQVYEYTEIDADLLQTLHPDIYRDLQEMVEFPSRQEMYRYLESIST